MTPHFQFLFMGQKSLNATIEYLLRWTFWDLDLRESIYKTSTEVKFLRLLRKKVNTFFGVGGRQVK